jgi:hypothetical protein
MCVYARGVFANHDCSDSMDADRIDPLDRTDARRAFVISGVVGVLVALVHRDVMPDAGPLVRSTTPDLEDAARRGSLCSSKDLPGVGLLGQYFEHQDCRGAPCLTRVDAVIDFDGGFDWPADRGAVRPRSIRWTGWIRAPLDGHYRFHLDALDASLELSRMNMLAPDRTIELHLGRYYPIVVTLARLHETGRIRLEWTAPHGARYLIPRALLQPPSDEPRRS